MRTLTTVLAFLFMLPTAAGAQLTQAHRDTVRAQGFEFINDDWAVRVGQADDGTAVAAAMAFSSSSDEPGWGILMLTCSGDRWAVLYQWPSYFFGDSVEVEYDFDYGRVVRSAWLPLNPDRKGVFMPLASVPDFRREAESGDVVILSARDPALGIVEVHGFFLEGLSEALSHLPCVQED